MAPKRAAAIAAGVALLGAALLASPLWGPDPGAPPALPPGGLDSSFAVEGVESRTTSGSRPGLRIAIGSLVRQKRTFGAFVVNPLEEIVLREVELSLPGRDADAAGRTLDARGLAADLLGLVPPSRTGVLTRVRIEHLEARVPDATGHPFAIEAKRAALDPEANELRLEGGFSVRAPSGARLAARKARWILHEGRLAVRGSYRLTGPVVETGADGEFTLSPDGTLARGVPPAAP